MLMLPTSGHMWVALFKHVSTLLANSLDWQIYKARTQIAEKGEKKAYAYGDVIAKT